MDESVARQQSHQDDKPESRLSETRDSKASVRRDFWVVLAVALPGLYLFPHFRFLQHANEMPRLFVTESLVERGSLSIDKALHRHAYRKQMDLSRSFCLSRGLARALTRSLHIRLKSPCREHFYSNKAPGPSIAAVPFYWMAGIWARLWGRSPRMADRIWWSRFGVSWLPSVIALLALVALGRRLGLREGARHVMVLAYGLGSMALVYSLQFMSHQLAAAGVIVSLALLTKGDKAGPGLLMAAGLAAGVALAADYQSAFILAILAVYGLVLLGFRRALWALLGGMPVLIFLAWYHWRCFGWPTWTGYEFLVDSTDLALHVRHPLGLVGPRPGPFRAILWSSSEGLLFLAPWLGLAIFGLARLLRLGGGRRPTEAESRGGSVGDMQKEVLSQRGAAVHTGLLLAGLGLVGLLVADHATSGLVQRWMVRRLAGVGLRTVTGSSLPVVLLAWWAMIWTGAVLSFGFRRDWIGPLAHLADAMSVGAAFVAPLADFLAQGPESRVVLWTLLGAWQALGGFSKGRRARDAGLLFLAWNLGVAMHLLPWQGSWHWVGWLLAVTWALESARSRGSGVGASGPQTAWPKGRDIRFAIGLVGLVAGMVSLWFVPSLSFWQGGWQVGPRYLAVGLPILALAAGMAMDGAWEEVFGRALVGGLVLVGLFAYVTTAAVFPHFPKSFKNPLFDLIWYLMAHGHVAKNLGSRFLGLHGVGSLVPLFSYVALLAAIVLSGGTEGRGSWGRGASFVGNMVRNMGVFMLSVLVAATILFGYSRLPRTNFDRCCRWIITMWDKEHASRWNAP